MYTTKFLSIAIVLVTIGIIGVYFWKGSIIEDEYKKSLMLSLQKNIPLNWNSNRCIMSPTAVNANLRCLRKQQLRDYNTEYQIIKGLYESDVRGYKELQTFTIMLSKFFRSYAFIFGKNADGIMVEMMTSDNPMQGGNIGKNLKALNELLKPVTDFSSFKMGDTRPNHREFTQAILCNSKKWCSFMWLMTVGLVQKNDKVLKLIQQNNINMDNLKLRIHMIELYLSESIEHVISTLCDVSNINDGIPKDACQQGNKGKNDLKCDIFCGGVNTLCNLIFKAFSFYKAMGKSLDPPLQLSYDTGYGANLYNPERFKKLRVNSLLPPPSSRELSFWSKIRGWQDKEYAPWPNAMNVILTNPGNPMADLSASRQDLSVAGTSGHAESILSIAILFDRYKDPQKLKDLIRGMIVSICPHHHSIREIATAAFPPPYNIDFKFSESGPLDIIKNLL